MVRWLTSGLASCVIDGILCLMTTETTGAGETWIPSTDDFGSRLSLVRRHMGWNIKEAARECGVSGATWRLWEVDGGQPRNVLTIAMTIATRTGVDYLWLVHGPNRGGAVSTRHYVSQRVVARIADPGMAPTDDQPPTNRPVRQTRPIAAGSNRPLTPIAV